MPIKRVGIELEGGWHERPMAENLQMVEDGSVEGLGTSSSDVDMCECSCECEGDDRCGGDYDENCNGCHVCRGETCLEPEDDTSELEFVGEARPRVPLAKVEVLDWVDMAYPSKYNETCGLHIHVSFDQPWEYVALQTQEFYESFLAWAFEHARRQGDLTTQAPRLRGENRYCRRWNKRADLLGQVDGQGYYDERYRHVNFCWAKHGTLEFRLWGMTTPPKARALVKGTLEFVERWLLEHAREDAENGQSEVSFVDELENNTSEVLPDAVAELPREGGCVCV